jgi:hypothetical protein
MSSGMAHFVDVVIKSIMPGWLKFMHIFSNLFDGKCSGDSQQSFLRRHDA